MRRFEIPAMAPLKAKTTPPTASKTEAPGRTKEDKQQKENDRKRQQKERRATRRELETSNVGLTSPAANDTPTLPATSAISSQPPPPFIDTTISTPSPVTHPISPPQLDLTAAEARSAHVLPAAAPNSVPPIPHVPQFVFDDYRRLLDDREEDFIAANDADGTLEGLLSLALQIGWQAGWNFGRECGVLSGKDDGRRDGVMEGRKAALAEAKAQPPPVVREFTTTQTQTDAPAVIPSQETLPPLTVTTDIVPTISPVPRDLTALQTGSPRPFGTLQRRLARSRNSRAHAQKKSPPVPTHPTVTRRHPHGIASNKPILTTSVPLPPLPRARRQHHVLDWDRDPLLSDLGRALGALGWVRGFG